MNLQIVITKLEHNGSVFRRMVENLPADVAHHKPAPDKWSIVEVLSHLLDEERHDFRKRVELTLKDPREPWPKIDPQGWVTSERYNERELTASLERFETERKKSVAWLKTLQEPNWANKVVHPQIGEITAGDLLASWLCHDYMHMAQIARLLKAAGESDTHPFSTRYASP